VTQETDPASPSEDVTKGPPNRALSPAANGLRYALQSGLPELEQAALKILSRLERKHSGHLVKICEELGVSYSTYGVWLRTFPELGRIHQDSLAEGKPKKK